MFMENHLVNYNEHSCPLRREEERASRASFFASVFHSLVVSQNVVLVAQSHPTLCHPVDCSTPGSSVCGILQVRKPFHSLYFHKLSATKWTIYMCVCVSETLQRRLDNSEGIEASRKVMLRAVTHTQNTVDKNKSFVANGNIQPQGFLGWWTVFLWPRLLPYCGSVLIPCRQPAG